MFVVVMSALPAAVMAQADAALNATRVADFIVLGRNPAGDITFTVDRDARARVLHPLGDSRVLSVGSGGAMNVMLRYLNPLRFTWTIDNKETDEPLASASRSFLDAATNMFAIMGGDVPQSVAGAGVKAPLEAAAANASNQPNPVDAVRSLAALPQASAEVKLLAQRFTAGSLDSAFRYFRTFNGGAVARLQTFLDPAAQEWHLWVLATPLAS
jgi:hypothetical protein